MVHQGNSLMTKKTPESEDQQTGSLLRPNLKNWFLVGNHLKCHLECKKSQKIEKIANFGRIFVLTSAKNENVWHFQFSFFLFKTGSTFQTQIKDFQEFIISELRPVKNRSKCKKINFFGWFANFEGALRVNSFFKPAENFQFCRLP